MTIAYADVLAEVAGNLQMDPTDTELLSKFDILNKANAAQRAILRKAPVTQIDNILKSVTGDLSINVAYYQWPSDFIRVSDLWVDYDSTISDTNIGNEAVLAPKGIFNARSLDKRPSQIYPSFFWVDGGFELRPIPDGNVTDGFMLKYVYEIPDMAPSTQDSLLRSDLQNALVFKTTELCALVDEFSPEMANRFGQLFMDEIAGLWADNVDLKRKKD